VKKLILILLIASLFGGCHLFKYYDQKEECMELLDRSQNLNKEYESFADSIIIDNMRLKEKLKECQNLRDSRQQVNN
jgi:hypothetical protein